MISVVTASLETGRGRVERSKGGAIVVGRDARCDVVVDGRGVSGSHFRLSPMPELPGAYLLEDLASSYGTFVNNNRVGRPVVVSGRDVISIGGHMLMLAQQGQEQAAIDRLSALAAPDKADAPPRPKASVESASQLAAFDPRAPWIQQFEHFDELARSWQDSGRPKSKLLRGAVVKVAERWIAAGVNQSPAPGALHRDFIEQSRNRRAFRLQILIGLIAVGVLTVSAAVVGVLFRSEISTLLVPPEVAVVSESEAPVEQDAPSVVDISALCAAVQDEPDTSRRLLLQAAVADVARAQGKPLLSEAVWPLLSSVNGTLGERRETVLRGHTGPVTDVAFSPDGLQVASASEDGSARLWDFSVPAPGGAAALRGHIGPVNVVKFSPQGDRLATGGDDGQVIVWRVDGPEPGATGVSLKQHESSVRVVTWHPDGKRLVSGDDAGTIVVWDTDEPQEPTAVRAAHDGPITAMVFDRGTPPTLFSGADDRRARHWMLGEDGSLGKLRTFDEHVGGVTSVAVSDDGRWAATATTSGELMLWPRWTRKRRRGRKKGAASLPPFPLLGHRESIASVAFTPDGHWLVSAGGGGVRMWNLQAKDPGVASVVLPGHTGDVTEMVLAAGNRAVTGATDNKLRVWDLEKSQKVLVAEDFEGHRNAVRAVAVSGDGLRIVSGADDETVRVWDAFDGSPGQGASVLRVGPTAVQAYDVTESGQLLGVSTDVAKIWTIADRARWRVPRVLEGAAGQFSSGAFDQEGEHVAVGSEAGQIFVWTLSKTEPQVLEGHTGTVNALAFLPDGRLISASSDRAVLVWDLEAPEEPIRWNAHTDEIHELAVTAGGEFAFTGGLNGTLVRWSIADGTPLSMPGHDGEILQLRLSPDGTRLASGSADRRARLWEVASGKSELVFRAHDEAVQALAFGRSRWLATGGADARIYVWDLTSAHPDEAPRVLTGHELSVTSLAFTRDTQVLASASNDETIRLWRLDTDRQLVLPGHDGVVAGLSLAADGTLLVSAGFDGTVRAWPLAHTTFTRLICDVVGETLPTGEAARTLGVPVGDPCADSTGRR